MFCGEKQKFSIPFCLQEASYLELLDTRAQLFKTNGIISERIVKTLIIKYGIFANIFAEKR